MPLDPSEASAALLLRVWTEQGDPGSMRFRILVSTPELPTHVVAQGEGSSQLVAAVGRWLEAFASATGVEQDNSS